jgi:hypothetical protein
MMVELSRRGDAHYPGMGPGAWRQQLNRRGQPLPDALGLLVKDPFHLPWAMIYCIEVLDRLFNR